MPRPLASSSLFVFLAAAVAQTPAAPAPLPAPVRVVPYPIDLPDDFTAAIAAGTRTRTGRPGPNHWTNTAHYRIQVDLDPVTKLLRGQAEVTYHNASPRELDRLVVHLYQDLLRPSQMRTRVVDPLGGIDVQAVRLGGQPVRTRVADTRMTIRLPAPLAPGAEIALEFEWSFTVPPAGAGPRMGHEDENVFYLGYWYPQIAVFDDVGGWVADPYRGNGEFYMGYADYDVAITVPQGYLVRATGELQNADDVLTEKARAALALARQQRDVVHVVDAEDLAAGRQTATAPDGRLTWRFRAERVRDVAISAARTYLWDATHAVVKDKDGPGLDGTAMIHAVYEPGSGDWKRGAEYTRHTIEYLSAHVHPYPWPHMTACEGIIGGGMEYPMMTIVGGTQPGGTIAHEVVHMWFPMLVGSNEKRYAWQDEGFTSFWTTLCRDDFLGRSRGPRRDVLAYANTVRRGGDVACMRHADTYGSDDFGFASYGKPAAILHQLRGLLGDELFFGAFRRYAADWAWKHPTPYDFFHTFSDVSGQDLAPYFRTWFFETWRLDHAIAAVTDDGDGTVVALEDQGRAVHPAVVEATYPDGRKERRTVPAAHWQQATRAELRFGAGVGEVVIDPDLTSLDCDREDNRWQRPQ
ncbi:MAG: M1 family metallopeptidase [Planctomycetes bacterium]|nr:M1 family metallopeptidase [Planctomycetota bacterium]